MNQHILGSSSGSSASSTRSLSPMSDIDLEDESHRSSDFDDSDSDIPLYRCRNPPPFSPASENPDPTIFNVNTAFNIDHKLNKKFPGPKDRSQRLKWSAREQNLAAKAVVCHDIDDLRVKVSQTSQSIFFYLSYLLQLKAHYNVNGQKKTGKYIKIEPSLFDAYVFLNSFFVSC